jgi:hypothetical protein
MMEHEPLVRCRDNSIQEYSGGESSFKSSDIEDISFDSVVTYKDFSFDEALAEQTRFRNAQSI